MQKVFEAARFSQQPRSTERLSVPILEAKEGILSVHINTYAEAALDPAVKYLASEDYIMSHAVLSGTRLPSENQQMLTSKSFGRAIPIARGTIPFNGMIGKVIVQKGGGFNWENPIRAGSQPQGFMAEQDILRDMMISNALIEQGVRASLILGYAVLDPDWIIKNASERDRDLVIEQLKKIKDDRDKPVVMFRVDGTEERMNLSYKEDFSAYRFQSDLALAARTFIEESKLENGKTKSYIASLSFEDQNKIINILEKLGTKLSLTSEEFTTFRKFCYSIGYNNNIGIEKCNLPYGYLPITLFSTGKDIDLLLFMKDFDEIYDPKLKQRNMFLPRIFSPEYSAKLRKFESVSMVNKYNLYYTDALAVFFKKMRELNIISNTSESLNIDNEFYMFLNEREILRDI